MALARAHVWNPGDLLKAADLNGEFDNILNNPITLISPTTAAIVFSTLQTFRQDQIVTSSGGTFVLPTVFNVKAYGATGNGTTDDTASVQAAITAAAAVHGTVYAPPGTYSISQLNLTNIAGLSFVGDSALNGTIFMPRVGTAAYGTATGHLFDCTGSSYIKFHNFQVGASNQTAVPTTAFFLAQVAGLPSTGYVFDHVYVSGKYTTATLYNYGVSSCMMTHAIWYNYQAAAVRTWLWTANNSSALTSSFATVTSGDIGVSEWTLNGCEVHSYNSTAQEAILYEGATAIRHYGGNINMTGGTQHVRFAKATTTQPAGFVFNGVNFFSTGAVTSIFGVTSSAVLTGLDVRGLTFSSSYALMQGLGAVLGGAGNIQIVRNGAGNINAGTTTYLMAYGQNATLQQGQGGDIWNQRGLFNDMRITIASAPLLANTGIATVNIGGVDSAVTATLTSNAVTALDQTHYAEVTGAGTLIGFKYANSTGAQATPVSFVVGFLPFA